MSIPIDVGAWIKIPSYAISERQRAELKEACTVVQPPTNDSLGQTYRVYKAGAKFLEVPRGILPFLEQGLGQLDIKDERFLWTLPEGRYPSDLEMRPHQIEQIKAIKEGKEGIIVAPPGSGKTITVLKAIQDLNQRALIIVDKINVAIQWKNAWLKLWEPGQHESFQIIGGGFGNDLGDKSTRLTIALVQSLNANEEKFLTGLGFGFVCLDECHHVSASTYLKTFSAFRSKYRIGVSATPTRDDGLEKISQLVIGPILHRVTTEELEGNKFLVKPKVERVHTNFKFSFWPTHTTPAFATCDVPNCKKNGMRHSHRNNYAALVKALVEDEDRNKLIRDKIYLTGRGKTNLVVSDRLEHLTTLRDLCADHYFDPDRLYMLTGKEKASEREAVYVRAGYGDCVIFSTIAKEALDIPRLDRLYLTYPLKAEHLLEQQIGRVTRAHPDKVDALVIDFVDSECSILNGQAYKRQTYYAKKQYEPEGKWWR